MKLSEKYFDKYIKKNIYGNTGFPQTPANIKTYGKICHFEGMKGMMSGETALYLINKELEKIAKQNNLTYGTK